MFKKICEGDIFSTKKTPFVCGGSRTAQLLNGKYICVFNTESKPGINDWVPLAAWSDDGKNWGEAKPLWPELIGKKSLFVSVRKTLDGRVSVAGMGLNIDEEGEPWWSDENSGIKENFVVWSISDDGYSFPLPEWVELPYYGSAEIPGGMLVDEEGALHIVYAPYRTIEQREETDTCCLVYMKSTDSGKTFEPKKIGKVDAPSLYAETWIVKLTNDNLMVSTWQTASADAPDQYLLSFDGGKTFTKPEAWPFIGQSTALEPWVDGKALVVYNQRKAEPAGVYIAAAKPDENGLNMFENQIAWEAYKATRGKSGGDFNEWTDFAFGEPHVTVMPNGNLLVCLWYEQDNIKGIRYVIMEYEK